MIHERRWECCRIIVAQNYDENEVIVLKEGTQRGTHHSSIKISTIESVDYLSSC